MTDHSLQVDAEGHPHIAYGYDHLYYSYFDGSGWQDETVDASIRTGQHASLALDQDGQPHICYAADGSVRYAYRNAAGWHVETIDPAADVQDTAIALDPQGYTHIAYVKAFDTERSSLNYAYRDANGWQLHPGSASRILHSDISLAVGFDGAPHVTYGIVHETDDVFYVELWYKSRLAGAWEASFVAAFGGANSSVAVDAAGRPRISYQDSYASAWGGRSYLGYAYLDGTGWHTEILDQAGFTGYRNSIALDPLGWPHISCASDSGVKHAYLDNSGWHIEAVSDGGRPTSIAVGTDGQPYISYYDYGELISGALKYASQQDGQWITETIAEEGRAGDYSSLALDDAGAVHFAYDFWGYGARGLRYARQPTSGWPSLEIANGSSGSLAVDGQGFPHVGYFDEAEDRLVYAFMDRSGWHEETVGDSAVSGWYPSLALDPSGVPHIAYCDSHHADLRYAIWSAEQWTIEIVDDVGWVEWNPSLALDAASFPHVLYLDADNDSLRYAYRDAEGWHTEFLNDSVFYPASLTLDSGNRPHVSYSLQIAGSNAMSHAVRDEAGWHSEIVEADIGWLSASSLALDSVGNPHVAYYAGCCEERSLHYARFDGANWQLQSVDSGEMGRGLSLALDGQGHAFISYSQAGDLKLAAQVASTPTLTATPTPMMSPTSTPTTTATPTVTPSPTATQVVHCRYLPLIINR
jgi:hypothetical protein